MRLTELSVNPYLAMKYAGFLAKTGNYPALTAFSRGKRNTPAMYAELKGMPGLTGDAAGWRAELIEYCEVHLNEPANLEAARRIVRQLLAD